ncbi:MAG: ATP-binding protein, partial [Proteobacteria bacterium]|nr:ATP-binding protein [Pseudomonadota bacterium]
MSNKPERLAEFSMSIQGGMLEALGINMYTTLGKCLVEFVANGHDGDAKTVSIAIPEKKIEAARTKIRAEAKAKVADGKLDKFTSLLIPLPEGIQVVVRDNGHGMLPTEIQEKFLPLNRKRRLDLGTHNESVLMSESGGRYVMGRKGLGKLAGFGAAECVTIETKRKGETFSTKLVLDLIKLGNQPNVTGAPIPAVYTDALPAGEHYTIVTLSRLKCDAVKFGLGIISETLAEAFHGVLNQGFEVKLNGKRIDPPKVSYEFTFPPKAQRKHNG